MTIAPDSIEAVYTEAWASISGIQAAVDHEPQRLPPMPCVTMLFSRYDPFDAETGPGQDVTLEWRVRLYASLSDYRQAQQRIKDLIPPIINEVRLNPKAWDGTDDLADIVTITDQGNEPAFSPDDGYAVKELLLRAVLTDT